MILKYVSVYVTVIRFGSLYCFHSLLCSHIIVRVQAIDDPHNQFIVMDPHGIDTSCVYHMRSKQNENVDLQSWHCCMLYRFSY